MLPDDELLPADLLAEPVAPEDDFPLLESDVLLSFLELEVEPALAFVEDDFEPEADEDLLLSSFAEVDEVEEPDVAPIPEFWLDPNPLVLLPPLLLLLLLAVLPDDEPCMLDELSDEFFAWLEF
ncbi:hypothetical protein GCM10023188_22090 [Pontibacter saemangeumensis]|uniref:Uncharacterized protein n=1 Tax=Pontibacter saemangeumensis TaxID=1084525 RepID=A0ABP8LNE9_9BACT